MAILKTINTEAGASELYNTSAHNVIIGDSYVEVNTRVGDFRYDFNNYESISLYKASFSCSYSYIVFNKNGIENDYGNEKNETTISFCCGLFKFKKSAILANEVYEEIMKAFNAYKENN